MVADRLPPWLAAAGLCALLAACGTMRSSVVVEPPPAGAGSLARAYAAPARTRVPGGSYEVMKGDTLYSIAFRKGVDFRDLAQWNGIAAPYTIWPGQRLRLSPSHGTGQARAASGPARPAAAPAAPVFVPVAPAREVAAVPRPPVPKPAAIAPAARAAATAVVPVAGAPAPAALPPPAKVAAGASRAIGGVSWRWPADGRVLSRFSGGDAIPGIEIAGKSGDVVRAAADGVVVYSGNGLVGYGELVIIKHNDSFLSAYGHNRRRLVKEGQRVSAGQPIAEMGSTGATRDELEFQIRKDGNPVDPLDYLPPR
ncbi:MAG: peptidoglycan DD-metalloendopeptidase family protein [Xanthomonadaceae bacterium]|nr:peptidoglycan DD-metalloendopeptidase family protein [Xanthomonadaceae bacterium]